MALVSCARELCGRTWHSWQRSVLGDHLSFISVAVMKFPDRNDKGEGDFTLAPNSGL